MNSIDVWTGAPLWARHGFNVWMETATTWDGKAIGIYKCHDCGARWTHKKQYDRFGPFCDKWLEEA